MDVKNILILLFIIFLSQTSLCQTQDSVNSKLSLSYSIGGGIGQVSPKGYKYTNQNKLMHIHEYNGFSSSILAGTTIKSSWLEISARFDYNFTHRNRELFYLYDQLSTLLTYQTQEYLHIVGFSLTPYVLIHLKNQSKLKFGIGYYAYTQLQKNSTNRVHTTVRYGNNDFYSDLPASLDVIYDNYLKHELHYLIQLEIPTKSNNKSVSLEASLRTIYQKYSMHFYNKTFSYFDNSDYIANEIKFSILYNFN